MIICQVFLLTGTASAVVLDSFVEDFDAMTSGATIDGVEFWQTTTGAAADSLVQSGVTSQGSGKALKLTGTETPVTVARATTYGGVTPTWVRLLVRPGLGSKSRDAPSSGIAAVSFDFSGKVLAADGTGWVETGKTFSEGQWWDVLYKLNFTNHTYDLYLSPVTTPPTSFIPAKTGLGFIDPSKNSMSSMEVQGAYSTSQQDDSFVDDFTVTYIERIGFITAAKTLVQDQAAGPFTIQLQNSLFESQRAVEDVFLELKSTSSGGTFSLTQDPWGAITQLLLPKDATTVSFYYKDSKVGKPILSVKESPDQGWLEGLQEQEVVTGEIHFEVLVTTPQTAGVLFSVTVNARAVEGQIDETYDELVGLSVEYVDPVSGTKLLTPAQAQGFSQGSLNLSVMYPDAGSIRIVVTDLQETDRTGKSGAIVVFPDSFQVEVEEDQQVVREPFDLTVTALNALGQVTPNYAGAVNLGIEAIEPETSAGGLTPATIAVSSFNFGEATVEVMYPLWGKVEISATEASFPQLNAKSGPVMFHPDAVRVTVSDPPSGRDFFYAAEPFDLEVTVLDAQDAAISNFDEVVLLDAHSSLDLPSEIYFVSADNGRYLLSASGDASGTYAIQASEPAAGLTSESVWVEIKEAVVVVVSTVGPVGGSTEVTILLQDEDGNLIQSESEAVLRVKLVEGNPNDSVRSSAIGQLIRFIKGKATLVIFNTEEEVVTLIPTALFGSRVKPGTVSFGRYATRGVGILLWREVPPLEEDQERE